MQTQHQMQKAKTHDTAKTRVTVTSLDKSSLDKTLLTINKVTCIWLHVTLDKIHQ